MCGVLSAGVVLCVCGVERSFARSAAVWRHVSPPIADFSFIKSFLNKLFLMCKKKIYMGTDLCSYPYGFPVSTV